MRTLPPYMRHVRAAAGNTIASVPAMTAIRDPAIQTQHPIKTPRSAATGRPFARIVRPMATNKAMTKYQPAALRSP